MNHSIIRKSLLIICCICLGENVCAKAASAFKPTAKSIMSYNLLYNSKNISASIKLIKRQNPDILCLTELTPKFTRLISKQLGKRYPYSAVYPKRGTWGVGIISKYPISKKSLYPIRPHRIPGSSAIVTIRKKKLLIACVHLFPPAGKHLKSDSFIVTLEKNRRLRLKQAKFLWKKFKHWKGPILLVGDMNEGRDAQAIKFLRDKGYRHSCVKVRFSQCGGTYPSATYLPAVVEIDHILGRGIKFTGAKVTKQGGSDHYPVSATFTLEPGS